MGSSSTKQALTGCKIFTKRQEKMDFANASQHIGKHASFEVPLNFRVAGKSSPGFACFRLIVFRFDIMIARVTCIFTGLKPPKREESLTIRPKTPKEAPSTMLQEIVFPVLPTSNFEIWHFSGTFPRLPLFYLEQPLSVNSYLGGRGELGGVGGTSHLMVALSKINASARKVQDFKITGRAYTMSFRQLPQTSVGDTLERV